VGRAEAAISGSRNRAWCGGFASVALALALTAAISPAASAAKKPDLRVTAVSTSATSAAGSGLEAADAIKNRGHRRAPRSTTGFLLSTDERHDETDLVLEGQRAVPKLKPRGKSRGQAHLRVAPSTPAGHYRLLACADIAGRIPEANESNNCQASADFVEIIASNTGPTGLIAPAPTAPAAPTGLATDPPSPAADTTPVVTGVAESGSAVELFTSSDCSGPVVASGPAAAFASPGFEITVAPGTTTRLSARAVDAVGNVSACSAPVVYEAFGSLAAFRFTDLDLRDPHVVIDYLGTRDITDTPFVGFSINGELQKNLTTDEGEDGLLDMSPVNLFDPFDQGAATMPAQIDPNATCAAPPQPIVCEPGTSPATATTATNASVGTCLDVLTATTTASYTPEVTTPTAPCFATDERKLTLSLAGIPVTLDAASVAATYVGDPATAEVNGLVRGFISEADADATIIPASYPLVGGKPLSSLFPGGAGNPSSHDDRDIRAGVTGWWIYLNFTASRTPWVQ
jgi:hypothetical protein